MMGGLLASHLEKYIIFNIYICFICKYIIHTINQNKFLVD